MAKGAKPVNSETEIMFSARDSYTRIYLAEDHGRLAQNMAVAVVIMESLIRHSAIKQGYDEKVKQFLAKVK